MIKWLQKVEKLLRDNLSSIIDNPKEIQRGLEKIRKREDDAYERSRDERLLNEGVEKYWTARDYIGLVNFLKNYKGDLKESIKKKYEYSLKKISKE